MIHSVGGNRSHLTFLRPDRKTDGSDLRYDREEEDAEVKLIQEKKDFQKGLELLAYFKKVKHNQEQDNQEGIDLLLHLKHSALKQKPKRRKTN